MEVNQADQLIMQAIALFALFYLVYQQWIHKLIFSNHAGLRAVAGSGRQQETAGNHFLSSGYA